MNGVLLVAAGGLAREVLALERAVGRFQVIRLIDDDTALWGSKLDGAPVVGGLEEVEPYGDSQIVVCAGHGSARRRIVARLSDLGVGPDRYATVVHPSVDVPGGCTVGYGSILLAQVVLTADVAVGRHVVAMPHVTLTHHDVVEDFVTLAAGVSLGGGVRVGAGSYLGMNASVRERVRVGPDATLGMGGALLRDLPAGAIWAGVPARPMARDAAREGVRTG